MSRVVASGGFMIATNYSAHKAKIISLDFNHPPSSDNFIPNYLMDL